MTKTKKSSNQIVKLALILFLVSAITAGILGFVNLLTKDKIDEQNRAATAKAYNEVLPYDGEYEPVMNYGAETAPIVDKISKAGDTGYVVELTFSGAQGYITAAVGVDINGTVTGVSVISHGETPSLGSRITESTFRDMFVGVTAGVALSKNGGSVEAITSATISSQAMIDAVNAAISAVSSLG